MVSGAAQALAAVLAAARRICGARRWDWTGGGAARCTDGLFTTQ
jgi:hypothetical protein